MSAVLWLLMIACEDPPTEATPPEPRRLDTWVPERGAPETLRRLVFLGDSVSAGWGASAPERSYKRLLQANDDDTWPAAASLDLERYGELEVWEMAIGGATTQTVRDGQLRALASRLAEEGSDGFTQVFMTVGGNDIQMALFGTLAGAATEPVADGIEARLDDILTTLTDPALFPDGVGVLFANIYDPTDDVGQADACFGGFDVGFMRPHLRDANARMREAAERHQVGMIDMYGAFQGHGMYAADANNKHHDSGDPTIWYTSDCIHPNDRGHHEIRRHFLAALDGDPIVERP